MWYFLFYSICTQGFHKLTKTKLEISLDPVFQNVYLKFRHSFWGLPVAVDPQAGVRPQCAQTKQRARRNSDTLAGHVPVSRLGEGDWRFLFWFTVQLYTMFAKGLQLCLHKVYKVPQGQRTTCAW